MLEPMASRINRWRPSRIDISLPATLAHVPIKPMTVATTVGATHAFGSPDVTATQARNATTQPRSAFISQVCTQYASA